MAKTELPILEQRRIEANIIKPIYAEMKAEFGAETAQRIIGKAVVGSAIAAGQAYAAAQTDGRTDLSRFHTLLPQWTSGGALEIEMVEETEAAVAYNVVRCRYAEMYREMGLAEIGHLLSCGRDGTFCKGFNPSIELERNQTIMSGASHCDFRYTMPDGEAE
jgi:hypothetical protein